MFLFCLVFAMFCARLFICALWSPAGKGLTSWLSFVVSTVSLSLSHWYPGSGVVLNCIDSWSLHPYLLCYERNLKFLPSLYSWRDWFETRFVGNPEDRFSRDEAQLWAPTCDDFQQYGILTSVDSDEPVQPPVKLRTSRQCSVSS